MKSLILYTTTQFLLPLLLLFSFFLVIRGHNESGGGFVGGLVASAAFALYTIPHTVEKTRKLLLVNTGYVIIMGITLMAITALAGFFADQKVLLEGLWLQGEVSVFAHLGTPILFDFGVYFAVLGSVLKIIFNLTRE